MQVELTTDHPIPPQAVAIVHVFPKENFQAESFEIDGDTWLICAISIALKAQMGEEPITPAQARAIKKFDPCQTFQQINVYVQTIGQDSQVFKSRLIGAAIL